MDVLLNQFLKKLTANGFLGDINTDKASRLVNATDNSAYQILPETIVSPRSQQDVSVLLSLAFEEEFHEIKLTPRGGGTGTNGQALNTGIIVDCSKYMTEILELNLAEGWVLVQPGVILDQLNDFLKSHDMFFAPNLSPSSRATLGGMASTDACGQGSMLYGKTSNHVLAVTAVYADGQVHTAHEVDEQTLTSLKATPGVIGDAYRQVDDTVCRCHEKIQAQFPKLTRFMTGYNLAHVRKASNRFNLSAVITGAEGTLAVITALKLKLTPIPKCKALFVLQYDSFHKALVHGKKLIHAYPAAIETVDHTILTMAKTDVVHTLVKEFVDNPACEVRGINLVEFVADNQQALDMQCERMVAELNSCNDAISFSLATTSEDMRNLWNLRKKSVGLLGKVKGKRKPTSGMEDTVVAPERLADYIKEFRELMDKRGLTYGMFGHVDAGCLHVRPALDFTNPADEKIYHELSDEVAALAKKYNGVMWGEHGKGYRSEYVPMFFGEELYGELRKIKQAFDPHNQLNPGKIAVPASSNDELVKVQAAKRGHFDKVISENQRVQFSSPLVCNGNGACFNKSDTSVMCPSYKVSGDRRYSPKGRASLIREWLRSSSSARGLRWLNSLKKVLGGHDFAHEVHDSMKQCLGCKACVTQCPVNVDIPSAKANFLQSYHQSYLRSLRDYAIAYSERAAIWQSKHPTFWNLLITNVFSKYLLKRILKLVDPPRLNGNQHTKTASIDDLEKLTSDERSNAVVIIQDWLTSYYQSEALENYCKLLTKLGKKVYVLSYQENGKPLYANGFLKQFKEVAAKTAARLTRVAKLNLPMIGIDPSITLTYRHEYLEQLGKVDFNVQLIQEWLVDNLDIDAINIALSNQSVKLFPHCSEQGELANLWKTVFTKLGIAAEVVDTGCCGMAGSYGHELEHLANSKKLFDMHWKNQLSADAVLVSGFSCESQVKRFTSSDSSHPVAWLMYYFQK